MVNKTKAVKAGKASVHALAEAIRPNVPALFVGQPIPTEAIKPWDEAELERNYQDFVSKLKGAYGAVTKVARAVVAGAVTDAMIRDFWAVKKEDDSARKFLNALKEALRTVQADAEGNLSKDAFTYNVNPKTGVLVREKVQTRENRKPSVEKLVKKVAFMFKKYDYTPAEKEKAIRLFTDAVMNPQSIIDTL
jgi:hypothetical protein